MTYSILDKQNISINSTLNPLILKNKSFFNFLKKIDFNLIKNEILNKDFKLSLIIVGRKKIKNLNFKYRKKNYATDVLSFNVENNIGEIFISPEIASIKSRKFDIDRAILDFELKNKIKNESSYKNYFLFLVIHAILHLKGMQHGSKMNKYEFKYYSRYRYRYI